MKDQNDRTTVDLFEPTKRRRGRPVTGQAMTNAERQKAYRQRLKVIQKSVTITKNQPTVEVIDWQARAHAIQSELDKARDKLLSLERLLVQRGDLVFDLRSENTYLKEQLRVSKGQATIYRNDNQALRNKIQILEFDQLGKS